MWAKLRNGRFGESGFLLGEVLVLRLVKDKWADGEDVHSGAEEAVDGLGGRIYDGLVFIEGGIEQDRNARDVAEAADQLPVEWVHVLLHRFAAGRCHRRASRLESWVRCSGLIL